MFYWLPLLLYAADILRSIRQQLTINEKYFPYILDVNILLCLLIQNLLRLQVNKASIAVGIFAFRTFGAMQDLGIRIIVSICQHIAREALL